MPTKNLPIIELFKKKSWEYKNQHNVKISIANNILAKEYGYKNYNSIKPHLKKAITFSSKFKDSMYCKLSNGYIVNSSGMFIAKSNVIEDNNSTSLITRDDIEKAIVFIDMVLEPTKDINYNDGTSYLLKSMIEDFIEEVFPFKDKYLTNGAIIVALDFLGYKIQEIVNESGKLNLNIYTNRKSLKNFRVNFLKEVKDIEKKINEKNSKINLTKKDIENVSNQILIATNEDIKNKKDVITIAIPKVNHELLELATEPLYNYFLNEGYDIYNRNDSLLLISKNSFNKKKNSITLLENGHIEVNELRLIPNNKYIIQPNNSRKKKHRDRICTFIEIEEGKISTMPQRAKVRFLDTKRVAFVDLIDLKKY